MANSYSPQQVINKGLDVDKCKANIAALVPLAGMNVIHIIHNCEFLCTLKHDEIAKCYDGHNYKLKNRYRRIMRLKIELLSVYYELYEHDLCDLEYLHEDVNKNIRLVHSK